MAGKSAVMLAVDETTDLLERYGAYMRDGRMVKGYATGHEGRGPMLDDDTALRIQEAMNDLLLTNDMMFIAVTFYFRGEKLHRTGDGNVPIVYYVQRNYKEIGARFGYGYSWAQNLVSAGVSVLHGFLYEEPCDRKAELAQAYAQLGTVRGL